MSHAAHLSIDIGSRLAQGGAVVHAAIQGALDGIEQRRIEDLTAVERLVVELGRVRRQAAAAQAESSRLARENAALIQALAQSRAAVRGYATALGVA